MKISTVKTGKLLATIRELTVKQVLTIMDSLPELTDFDPKYLASHKLTITMLAEKCIDCNVPLAVLKEKEILFLFEEFKKVNSSLFEKDQNSKPPLNKKAYNKYTKDVLIKSISTLIEIGHINVLNYEWSFYTSIINQLNKAKNG